MASSCPADCATLRSEAEPGGHASLAAMPHGQLRMEPAAFLAEIQQRLCIPDAAEDSWCPCCDQVLDRHGRHAAMCSAGGERTLRHHALRDGVLDQCLELQMTPLAWSPLGGGVIGLSPEEAEGRPDGARLASMLRVLDRIADEQNVSRTAVAMAWTMVHPAGVIPIIGTQRVERIQQCMDALKVEFTRTQWNEILVAAQGEPLP